MTEGIERRIVDIIRMDAAALVQEWQSQFGEAAPTLPLSLLRRALAHRLQEQAYRCLPASAERMLDMLAQDPSTQLADPPIRLKAGTRLLREWNGKVHAVLVTDDGMLFEAQTYRSLSHVARAITGAHWSGPRFFGLRVKGPPPSREAVAHG